MLRALYVSNAALLVAHEIDAAHWREWELLRLPGGEPGFVAVHVALAAVVIWGYGRLVEGRTSGLAVSLALGVAGALGAAIHGGLVAAGRPELRSPVSVAVLAAAAILSVAQAALASAALAEDRG